MTVSELLPCPMCGSRATLYNAVMDACIRCDGCRLTIRCDHDRVTDKVAHDWLASAWNRRTPARELDAEKGGEVEVAPGVKLPFWLLDYAQKVSAYMKLNYPGPWSIGGVQSPDFATPPAQAAEAVVVTDEMVERGCKRYAFREDGATFPDAYSEYEVLAERHLMREFLEHVLTSHGGTK